MRDIQSQIQVKHMLCPLRINAVFEGMRSLYFPRWDRQGRWRAVFGDAQQCRDETGYCDGDAETVYLDEHALYMMPIEGFRAFLIHEICHAVGAAHHNRGWAKRMERAAARADQLDESEVAEILRSDIYSYAGPGVMASYDVHTVLDYAEELMDENPTIDYAAAVRRVAKYFGYSAAKVRRDFGGVIRDVMAGIA